MLLQYTAAALASENKVLAHPASADSIPTSANQEDHVSMGPIAGRQARVVLDHVERIVAIELLCAPRALDLRSRRCGGARAPVAPGAGVAAHAAIRGRSGRGRAIASRARHRGAHAARPGGPPRDLVALARAGA